MGIEIVGIAVGVAVADGSSVGTGDGVTVGFAVGVTSSITGAGSAWTTGATHPLNNINRHVIAHTRTGTEPSRHNQDRPGPLASDGTAVVKLTGECLALSPISPSISQ